MLTIQNALSASIHTNFKRTGLSKMTKVDLKERIRFSELEIKSMVLSRENNKFRSPIVAAEFSVGKGSRRVDLAVLKDDELIGFEIKSDFDTLVRLCQQSNEYIKHFDKVILATTSKHLKRALDICPRELGIWVVCSNGTVEAIRDARRLRSLNSYDLGSMLTKAEKLRLLKLTDHDDIGLVEVEVLRGAVRAAFRDRYSDVSANFWSEVSKNGCVSIESLSALSRFAAVRDAVAQKELESARYWAEWNAKATMFFSGHCGAHD